METKESNAPYIINLINSIIGVSVLAMPFCLKKCGLILGLSLLIGMSWLTYISCNMLVTAAVAKRRRTYEYLAFYTVGPTGKFAVELSMIGLMLGTCVAFYVIIGDLATAILQEQVDLPPDQLRPIVIVFCALCVALPLGLMKNLSALGFIGIFSMIFYCLFVCVMLANSISSGFFTFEWLDKVHFFRPAGIFQCLPIFSLAYACQCQLFVVYDSLEDASLMRMETIVTTSLKIVTFVYCTVAILGYTAYVDAVDGNVLKNFSPNFVLDLIKIGFAISVVVGFPLMIFPCRRSIHTLFFSQRPTEGIVSKTYIEPFMFKAITLCIVLSTMMVALFIPNVETILGLTGATMGSTICFIFPGIIFSKASPKEDTGISKFVFGMGCVLLVLCTYSNVYPATEIQNMPVPQQIEPIQNDPKLPDNLKKDAPIVKNEKLAPDKPPIAEVVDSEHRHEPANPIEPIVPDKNKDDEKEANDKLVDDTVNKPIPDEVNRPLPPKELENQIEVKNPPVESQNKDTDVKEQEKINTVNKPVEVIEKPPNNDHNMALNPKKEEVERSPEKGPEDKKESDRSVLEKEVQVDVAKPPKAVNGGDQLKKDTPKEKKPAEVVVEPKVDNSIKKEESVAKPEPVIKRDAEKENNNEEVKDGDELRDQGEILKQLKEQQQKQQQLLKEEEHLINFLEKSQKAKEEEKNIQNPPQENENTVNKNSVVKQDSPIVKEEDNANQVLESNDNKQLVIEENAEKVPVKQAVDPRISENANANLAAKKEHVVPNIPKQPEPVAPQLHDNVPKQAIEPNSDAKGDRKPREVHENLQIDDNAQQFQKEDLQMKAEVPPQFPNGDQQPLADKAMSQKVLERLNGHSEEPPLDSISDNKNSEVGNQKNVEIENTDDESREKKPKSRDLKSVS